MPPIDPKTIADSAAVIKQAMETLRVQRDVTQARITSLRNQIAALRKASIPPSDVIQFLKDYIDAKASEYLAVLNHQIAHLIHPSRSDASVLSGSGEPLSFDEYESLLAPEGEALLGLKFWANPATLDGGPLFKHKMLGLFSSDNNFGWGRAFCFFFGEEMKRALDANADKIVIPSILASKMHESTRAQRRAMLDDLQKQIKGAEQDASAIYGQMKAIGANIDMNDELKFVIR